MTTIVFGSLQEEVRCQHIYKGMLEFMLLQILAIALIVAFPAIATRFPQYLHEVARLAPTEQVEDSIRLEDYAGDPYSGESDAAGREGEREMQSPQ